MGSLLDALLVSPSSLLGFLEPADLLRLEQTCTLAAEACRSASVLPQRTSLFVTAFHSKLVRCMIEASAYDPVSRLLCQAYSPSLCEVLRTPLHRFLATSPLQLPTQESYHLNSLLQLSSRHDAARWFLRRENYDGPAEEGFYRLAQAFGASSVDVAALKRAFSFLSYGLQLLLLRETIAFKRERGEDPVDLSAVLASTSSPGVVAALRALPAKGRQRRLLKELLVEVLPDADRGREQLCAFRAYFQTTLLPAIHGFLGEDREGRHSKSNSSNVLLEAFQHVPAVSSVLLKHLVETSVASTLSYRRMTNLLIAYLCGEAASAPAPSVAAADPYVPSEARPLCLQGDTADYADIRNSLLDCVLLRGKGLPISLSVIMSAVSSGAGLHGLSCAALPGHVMVRADENEMIRKRKEAEGASPPSVAGLGGTAAAPPPVPPSALPLFLIDPFRGGMVISVLDGPIMPRDIPVADPLSLWIRSINNMLNSVEQYCMQGENPAFLATATLLHVALAIAGAQPDLSTDIHALVDDAEAGKPIVLRVPDAFAESTLVLRHGSIVGRFSRRATQPFSIPLPGGGPSELLFEPDLQGILKTARHHERRAAAAAATAAAAGTAAGSNASDASSGSSSGSSRPRRATLFQTPSGSVQQPGRTSTVAGVGGGGAAARASAYQPVGVLDKLAQTAFRSSQQICRVIHQAKPLLPEWEKATRLHPFARQHKRTAAALFLYFCYAAGLSSPRDVFTAINGNGDDTAEPVTLPFISAEVAGAVGSGEGSLDAALAAAATTTASCFYPGNTWQLYPDFASLKEASPLSYSPAFLLHLLVLRSLLRLLDGRCDQSLEERLWQAAVEGRPVRGASAISGGSSASSASSSSSSFVEPLGLISAALAHAIISFSPPFARAKRERKKKKEDLAEGGQATSIGADQEEESEDHEDHDDDDDDDDDDEAAEEEAFGGLQLSSRRWPADAAPLGACFVLPGASAVSVLDASIPSEFAPRTEWRWGLRSPLLPSQREGVVSGGVSNLMRPWAILVDAMALQDDEDHDDDGEAKEEGKDGDDPEKAAASLARGFLSEAKKNSSAKKASAAPAANRTPTTARGFYYGVGPSSLPAFLPSRAASLLDGSGNSIAAVLLGSPGVLKTSLPAYATMQPCPLSSPPPPLMPSSGLQHPLVRLLPLSAACGRFRCPCRGDGSTVVTEEEADLPCEGHSILLPFGRSSLLPALGGGQVQGSGGDRSFVFVAAPHVQAHFVGAICHSSSSSLSSSPALQPAAARLSGLLPSLELFATAGRDARLPPAILARAAAVESETK